MNLNQNPIASYGTIAIITGEDDAGIQLYENTLQPSVYTNPFGSRKIACIMLSHYLSYIDPPNSLILGVGVHCINVETKAAYPILNLTGNYDTVNWMLSNEIEILDGKVQHRVEENQPGARKVAKVKNGKKKPVPSVKSDRIGFEYANRN